MYTEKAFKFLIVIFAIIGFIFVAVYAAVRIGLTNERGIIDDQRASFINDKQVSSIANLPNLIPTNPATTTLSWAKSEEWLVVKTAIIRDAMAIYRASHDVKVDPRMLVTVLVPEQLRLFHSEREIFKQIFAPLKILGNQSQFSWGIMGLKPDTAKNIEAHLKDSTSPFYLGKEYENILDFNTTNVDQERFERLTNSKDHYYSYLYAALFIREVNAQWKSAGHNISNRPEIIGTLYNIGFNNSHPNANPSSGGAALDLSGTTYSFGALAGEFYNSQELRELLPIK